MSGHVVHYPYLQVISVVYESRKQDASIAQICIEISCSSSSSKSFFTEGGRQNG